MHTVYTVRCAVYIVHCTIIAIHYTLYSIRYSLYSEKYIHVCVHDFSPPYCIQCTYTIDYTVHCTVYT